jgi:hypothetical protein
MAGWRRSVDRTRLQEKSLLTGNLTGKFKILGTLETTSEQNSAVVERLVDQFPAKGNRENISWIREMFDRNSEFYGPSPSHRLRFNQPPDN